jgi:hypothetical protein
MIRAAVLLSLIVLSAPAMAQASLIGASQQSCGSWTHERKNDSSMSYVYASWIVGYVSGLNATGVTVLKSPDLLKGIDGNAVIGWMDNYCRSHPLENLGDATVTLLAELSKKPR